MPPKNKAEPGLHARALRFLARREHSRLELARKLARYTEDESEIEHLLDEFERKGWLSEQRVVEQVSAVRRRRFGARRIAHELREKGISEDAINAELPRLKGSELAAAREVWRKKFGALPTNARDKARQIRFLQGRGFDADVIRRLLKSTADENE
ncbi:MAG TPA: recombination regulator RecX [Burkholderiales bacterium]|nr:recombination regulator RecX [Burkholderiales bacterium]